MYFLIIGMLLFFGTHFYSTFRTREPAHDVRIKMGTRKFMGLYSLVSGLGFALILWGYGLARPSVQMFTPPTWAPHVTMALMLLSLVFLIAAYGPIGHLKRFVRHPMLIGIILWSAGHLLANGEQNSVMLFSAFLIYSLVTLLISLGRPYPVKSVSIVGDFVALIGGVVIYYFFVTVLHQMLIGVPLNYGL
jgi:uncharacterized membrane protein